MPAYGWTMPAVNYTSSCENLALTSYMEGDCSLWFGQCYGMDLQWGTTSDIEKTGTIEAGHSAPMVF